MKTLAWRVIRNGERWQGAIQAVIAETGEEIGNEQTCILESKVGNVAIMTVQVVAEEYIPPAPTPETPKA